MATRIMIRALLGVLAGLITTPLALLLAYAVGLITIGISTRELFPTLLSAATVLPLMLLLVGLLPTLMISILTGLVLGLSSSFINGWFKAIGSLLGLILSEICLSLLLPRIIIPQTNDFTTIVSNPFVSASYGVAIGFVVGWLTGKLNVG